MKKLKLINLMSQHYTNSMDEICVPVIKKILGHYLELNPDYNNGVQRNNPNATGKEFREALINAENALRELKRFY